MIGSLALSLLLATAPGERLAERMAAPPATALEMISEARSGGAPSRAAADPVRARRRLLRKRQLLKPVMTRVHLERLDPSVTLLATELDLQTRTRRRSQDTSASARLIGVRLRAAGATACRIHLPPPHPLL